jgi:putative ABC transport system substrate-binding protein
MRRREFISLVGAAATAWPLAAYPQQPGKLRTIGFLGPASATVMRAWTAAFERRLSELGWVEGRTLSTVYRWGDGRSGQFAEVAAEFVRAKVDVIVTTGTAVPAFKQATSGIPIVFAISTDPIAGGLVNSLSRPEANVTGLSLLSADLGGKRLEMIREVVADVKTVATLANAANTVTASEMAQVHAAVRKLGLTLLTAEVQRVNAFKGQADALYVHTDPLMNTNRAQIGDLALAARLPTFAGIREYVEAGVLLSYGPSFADLFRRTAEYVDKILRGAKPSDLPVEQPTKFDLVFNLRTAKALGLATSESFLLRADEVIE